jgi:hypothetical protein
MKLPALSQFPSYVSNQDLHSGLEAMLAGLRCDPPDAFGEDWEETMEESNGCWGKWRGSRLAFLPRCFLGGLLRWPHLERRFHGMLEGQRDMKLVSVSAIGIPRVTHITRIPAPSRGHDACWRRVYSRSEDDWVAAGFIV